MIAGQSLPSSAFLGILLGNALAHCLAVDFDTHAVAPGAVGLDALPTGAVIAHWADAARILTHNVVATRGAVPAGQQRLALTRVERAAFFAVE